MLTPTTRSEPSAPQNESDVPSFFFSSSEEEEDLSSDFAHLPAPPNSSASTGPSNASIPLPGDIVRSVGLDNLPILSNSSNDYNIGPQDLNSSLNSSIFGPPDSPIDPIELLNIVGSESANISTPRPNEPTSAPPQLDNALPREAPLSRLVHDLFSGDRLDLWTLGGVMIGLILLVILFIEVSILLCRQ